MLPGLKDAVWYGPAIRWKQWKLLQGSSGGPETPDYTPPGTSTPARGGADDSDYLLFNLEQDPEEKVNVIDKYPVVFQLLRKKLQQYQESFVPPQPPMPWNDTTCDFHGPTHTSEFGPTWLPWCKSSTEFVFYQ
jgi:hypothetical protein